MDGWTDGQFLAWKNFRQLQIGGKMLYTSTYSCYQSFIGTPCMPELQSNDNFI